MHGKGKTGRRMERQEARCAEITPAPVWNGATRRGAGRRRMEKLRGIKKSSSGRRRSFLRVKTADAPADRASGVPWNTGG